MKTVKKSLRNLIFSNFTILIVLTILVFTIFSSLYYTQISMSKSQDYTKNIVKQTTEIIVFFFEKIEDRLEIDALDKQTLAIIESKDKPFNYSKLEVYRDISKHLTNTLSLNEHIKNYMILDNTGSIIIASEPSLRKGYSYLEQNWFPTFNDNLLKVNYSTFHNQQYYYNDNKLDNAMSIIIPIIDPLDPYMEKKGYLLFTIEEHVIADFVDSIQIESTGSLFIFDKNNYMINQPKGLFTKKSDIALLNDKTMNNQGTFNIRINGSNYLIVYKKLLDLGWTLYSCVSVNEVLQSTININVIYFLLSLLSILIIIILSRSISQKITNPLSDLMNRMNSIENGSTNIDFNINSRTIEISTLGLRLETMVKKIRKLTSENYLYKIYSTEAKLKHLQSQINPHFLFNSLQSLKAMAIHKRTEEISHMVTLMGNILRYGIYQPMELVPLGVEIQYIYDFMRIYQYRSPGRFSFSVLNKLQSMDFLIPKLIIQPIIENAINHGLSNKLTGSIEIEIYPEDDTSYLIKIIDDGCGMSHSLVSELRKSLIKRDESSTNIKQSLGISNVNSRIGLAMGKNYGIEINSIEGNGTTVTLHLPYNVQREDKEKVIESSFN